MDLPTAPKDIGLKNIIDKLAEFVARNGPEFEIITKTKQQGNPKFSFLYGGEYYRYYQWCVSNAKTNLNLASISQTQHQQEGVDSGNMSSLPEDDGGASSFPCGDAATDATAYIQSLPNGVDSTAMLALIHQQEALRSQIKQSEQNLSAQQEVLVQIQQTQIDEAIEVAQNTFLVQQAEKHNICLHDFDNVLQPIIDSCTKDSISTGKNWILQHTTDSPKCNVILQYLLKKALINVAPFTQKLHLIYLVNDVLHHCVRKRAEDLKNQLENIVIPMFCSGQMQASEDQKAKLTKLLSLWESKANFFDACVISKLKSPASSMEEYRTNLLNSHTGLVSSITQQTNITFENYKQQHRSFIQHAGQQIVIFEGQKRLLLNKQKQAASSISADAVMDANKKHCNQITPMMDTTMNPNNPFAMCNSRSNSNGNGVIGGPYMQTHQEQVNVGAQMCTQQEQPAALPNMSQPPPMEAQNAHTFGGNAPNARSSVEIIIPSNHQQQPQQHIRIIPSGLVPNGSFDQMPPNFRIPDMSRPPPGFLDPPPLSTSDVCDNTDMAAHAHVQSDAVPVDAVAAVIIPPQEVKPLAPFYELPAGLMVPLIRLEDYEYRPLDQEDLRLPPPIPPSERLLSAVEAFYAPPSHDRPRDGEGWEKLALYEYYKVKNSARKTKEDEIAFGIRKRSRSPSPIVIETVRPIKINKRRYRSRSRSQSPPAKQELLQSQSPAPNDDEIGAECERLSTSPPTSKQSTLEGDSSERDAIDLLKRSDVDRDSSLSPPPCFFGGIYANTSNDCIEESNKGHQMLMKMGWAGSGTGLGTHGQGIDAPISGGDIRDRQDQFKGVGINLNDPYANFRKNKGAAFIHRMRSRDTDRKVPNQDGSPDP